MTVAAGPPTRDAGSENFPVASLLLAPALRPKVLGFYRFVRTADDIADAPDLAAEEKLARLDALGRALDDPATDEPAARPIHDSGCGTSEARAMLAAFRQDATQRRYADWAALEAYCAASANPVGRMLVRLHGTAAPGAEAAADALCTALQVLNHLQDLGPDRANLDRIYLPVSWMALAGGEEAFFEPANAAPRRAVLDAALDRVEERLDAAAALPRLVGSWRLAMESRVTIALARRLLARLRAADPVAGRVALRRPDFARAFAASPFAGPSDAALVRARVAAAGSSFAKGMSALRGDRRRALWAVYAFCRAVDDIADGAMPEAEKRRFLADWRAKLERPDCALSRELARARDRYALPAEECEAMIAGMETDAAPRLRIADAAALDQYCRRVAGSVGAMAVRIFGAPEAAGFGLALGRTLQLVNILRDMDEDATRDRVYLPLDLLAAQGVADGDAARMMAAPGTAAAAQALAAEAAAGFARAEEELRAFDTPALLPARIMMWGYRRIFDRLVARGFGPPRARPRLTAGEKARMAAYALRLAPVAAR
ncbi:squalene/phytoene synthase family protein [Roseomonas sp. HF4]|uniref:squalene/phytoene synthase family protein n=1 Tax=Roseomonas sp. HF4 TaxID=2562313 RepID=UPI001484CB34|nr:squalene/phytoene synthase family protein [Roseomonas sp. HF4]